MRILLTLFILICFLVIFPFHIQGQVSPVYYPSNYIRVVQPEYDDSSDLASKNFDIVNYHNPKLKYDTLLNPFTGGLNNASIFNIDFNGDGIQDLYVFDRELGENQFLLFEGIDNSTNLYRYAPEYNYEFPVDVGRWVELADYNQDNLPDIFTNPASCNTCIKVYKNTSYFNAATQKFVTRFTVAADTLYYFDSLGSKILISVSTASNPQFVDIDKDGHLDILGFDLGLNSPQFYRNRGKGTDSLSFYYTKECWGYFEEKIQHFYQPWNCEKNSKGKPVKLNTYDPDSEYKVHSTGAHVYNSMCAFDVDGDGDIDLLLGDGLNDSLAFLENGNIDLANKSYHKDTIVNIKPGNNDTFPSDYPVKIATMPIASNVDINHDGLNDLVVSAGEPTNIAYDTARVNERIHNIWYYHNVGVKPANGFRGSNIFKMSSKDFLQNTMVDWGIYSAPCFIDVDKDGRKDLLIAVSDGSSPSGNSHLILYLNKAGKTAGSKPYLLFKTDDYLGFSKLAKGIARPVPTAYLNTYDSSTDLLMGDDSGRVMYFKDRSTGKNPADYKLASANLKYLDNGELKPIEVNANSAPTAADINGDGKTDLLIGSNSGNISYYRCLGFDATSDHLPYFELVTDTFGGINASAGKDYQTAPLVADMDRDGKPDLLVGDVSGDLFYYHDFDTIHTLVPTRVRIHDYGTNSNDQKQLSTCIIPAVDYLDQDSFPDIMLGCRRGGLFFLGSANNDLENLRTLSIDESLKGNLLNMTVFPNPASNMVTLEYYNGFSTKNTNILISDMLGRQVASHLFMMQYGKGDEHFSIAGLTNGIYIVEVVSGKDILYATKLFIYK